MLKKRSERGRQRRRAAPAVPARLPARTAPLPAERPRPSRPLPPLLRRFLLENRHRVFVSAVTRSSPRRAHKVGPGCSSPLGTKTSISCFSREAPRKRKSSRLREDIREEAGDLTRRVEIRNMRKGETRRFSPSSFHRRHYFKETKGNTASQTKDVTDF